MIEVVMEQTAEMLNQLADQLSASCREKFALGSERLQAGEDVLALLSIHGALEDGLRGYLAGRHIETGPWPELLATLSTESQRPLSSDEIDRLRAMNRLRNSLAHGEDKRIDHDALIGYQQFAGKLLRAYGFSVRQSSAPRRAAMRPRATSSAPTGLVPTLLRRYSNILVPVAVALLVFVVGWWILNGSLGRTSSTTRQVDPILGATSVQTSIATIEATSAESLSDQPATILPTAPITAPTASPQAIPGAIAVGGRAIVQTQADQPLNLRSQPSQSSEVLSTLATGSAVDVVEGPTQADGFTWWRVRAGTQEGWCAGEFLGVQAGP